MDSIEALDRLAGNAQFSREEWEELNARIKKHPYAAKLKNLADKTKASSRAQMDAKARQIITLKQREFQGILLGKDREEQEKSHITGNGISFTLN